MTKLDAILGYTPRPCLDRARARPFVKWAGGKRSLIPEIAKLLPDSFGIYWEPFVGVRFRSVVADRLNTGGSK